MMSSFKSATCLNLGSILSFPLLSLFCHFRQPTSAQPGQGSFGEGGASLCLVHGPFGCGKTHLLAGIITRMAAALERRGDSTTQLLVCAYTNTAVDRVLVGLLESGFTNFLRVGNARKIAARVLPFSVYDTRR